jgi:ubiquitin carboxyl-terminal hydrolase 4/11/15
LRRHTLICRSKIDEFVDFPVEGLDMDDRCDERRVAKTLVAQGKDLEQYGIDGNLEPLVYDLCKCFQDWSFAMANHICSDAVDNHYGGMGGGHYTATCKNMQDGKWYKFDDSHVSPAAGESDIKVSLPFSGCTMILKTFRLQSSAAYLLFYRRRTSRPIGGVTKQKIDVSVTLIRPIWYSTGKY